MLDRDRFLSSEGYSILLIDLQAHGESEDERIPLGLKECESVKAAVRFLQRTKNGVPIGLIGSSLGGASALLEDISPEIRFLILEAVFRILEALFEIVWSKEFLNS